MDAPRHPSLRDEGYPPRRRVEMLAYATKNTLLGMYLGFVVDLSRGVDNPVDGAAMGALTAVGILATFYGGGYLVRKN